MASAGGLESDVAIKVLRRDLDPGGQAVQRLRDEARLLARLDHPTILRVYDLVVLDGSVSLVTEFIDGEDLGAVTTGPEPLPVSALLEVIAAVAGALDAAWNTPGSEGPAPLRLVHRDVKPSNIRIGRHGQIKLLDFGIARSDAVEREARTQTNLMIGSPAYMAPERYLDLVVRPESDVFALGCCLYEGLCRGVRFHQEVPMPIMSALAVDRRRYDANLERRFEEIPGEPFDGVVALLRQLLDHDPAARPTAVELLSRCEALRESVPGRTLAQWARARRWNAPGGIAGPLEGRTITEGTLARTGGPSATPARAIVREPTADIGATSTRWEMTPRAEGSDGARAHAEASRGDEASKRPRLRIAMGLSGIAVLATVSSAVVLGVGGLLASGYLGVGPEPADTDDAVDAVEAIPAVEPRLTELHPVESPLAPPVAVADDAVSVPTAPPDTPHLVPPPAAAVAPPAALVPIALVATGDVSVWILDDGAEVALPTSVVAGTYEIIVRYPTTGHVTTGSLTVTATDPPQITCSGAMERCQW
jgi:serine/threonine-protein kinase